MQRLTDRLLLAFTLAVLRFYRRHLTRYTPKCPDAESCGAYAVRAVREHGARVGLQLALEKLERCGDRPPVPAPPPPIRG